MLKPFLPEIIEKWLLGSQRNKMVMIGRRLITFKRAVNCPDNKEHLSITLLHKIRRSDD